jgi:hypothetical protein
MPIIDEQWCIPQRAPSWAGDQHARRSAAAGDADLPAVASSADARARRPPPRVPSSLVTPRPYAAAAPQCSDAADPEPTGAHSELPGRMPLVASSLAPSPHTLFRPTKGLRYPTAEATSGGLGEVAEWLKAPHSKCRRFLL